MDWVVNNISINSIFQFSASVEITGPLVPLILKPSIGTRGPQLTRNIVQPAGNLVKSSITLKSQKFNLYDIPHFLVNTDPLIQNCSRPGITTDCNLLASVVTRHYVTQGLAIITAPAVFNENIFLDSSCTQT